MDADNSVSTDHQAGSDVNDETIAYEMEDADPNRQHNSEEEDGSDDGSSDEDVVRRSARLRKAPNVFTYDNVGGKPVVRPRR